MKNAFTLIEVLVVLIIISLVTVITTTILFSTGSNLKNKLYEDQVEKAYEISKELGFNELELDFSKSSSNNNINKLNEYFAASTPTNKTDYTGMFKGKNLIFSHCLVV